METVMPETSMDEKLDMLMRFESRSAKVSLILSLTNYQIPSNTQSSLYNLTGTHLDSILSSVAVMDERTRQYTGEVFQYADAQQYPDSEAVPFTVCAAALIGLSMSISPAQKKSYGYFMDIQMVHQYMTSRYGEKVTLLPEGESERLDHLMDVARGAFIRMFTSGPHEIDNHSDAEMLWLGQNTHKVTPIFTELMERTTSDPLMVEKLYRADCYSLNDGLL